MITLGGRFLQFLKLIFGIFLLFTFFIAQTSFIVHFTSFPVFLFLSFGFLFIWILFEDPKSSNGVILAAFTGFFWDVFSSSPLGIHLSILVFSAIFLKFILNNYVRTTFFQ